MPYYEAMIIVRPDAEKEVVDGIIERVEGFVRQDKGIVLDCEVLGKKRLAYEVKKFNEGVYVKINFEAPTKVVDVLKHQMQLSENVIRHMIVRTKTYIVIEVDEEIDDETTVEAASDDVEPKEEPHMADAKVADEPAVEKSAEADEQ